MALRIVFMGTPDFAVASLQAIEEAGHEVLAVVTATDKPGGRGHQTLLQSAVKQYALSRDLPLLQPEKLRAPEFIAQLQSLQADLFVVVAFRMLPQMVWSMPRLGTINLHGSLLPKYRGAAPINWALICGETQTGLTTFLINSEIDQGAILEQKIVAIEDRDDFGSLYEKMKNIGAALLQDTLQKLESGDFKAIPQSDEEASPAPKISLETGKLDFSKSARELRNLVRGLSPYPGAWFQMNGLIYKIYAAEITTEYPAKAAGTIEKIGKTMCIHTGSGCLLPTLIQQEGKKKMAIGDFVNGWNPAGPLML